MKGSAMGDKGATPKASPEPSVSRFVKFNNMLRVLPSTPKPQVGDPRGNSRPLPYSYDGYCCKSKRRLNSTAPAGIDEEKNKMKDWFGHYEQDRKVASVDLLTKVYKACGVKYEIAFEDGADRVVVTLADMAVDSSETKYNENLVEYLVRSWEKLLTECQTFDRMLLLKCRSYVVSLSCTLGGVFGLVASLVGLQLVKLLSRRTNELGSQLDQTQRLINDQKTEQAGSEERKEVMMIAEQMISLICTGLFDRQYGDINPDIKISWIESLRFWIWSYPSLFMQISYLKFLALALDDESAGVRGASVLALSSIFTMDEYVHYWGDFARRFARQMIALADDDDIPVAVCSVELAKQLLRHQLLTDEELDNFYKKLSDKRPEIRKAMGKLVYDLFIAQNLSADVELRRMVRILTNFPQDSSWVDHLLDCVWEHMKAMQDWRSIMRLLLDEPSLLDNTAHTTYLIRLLFISVRKAVGEGIDLEFGNLERPSFKAEKEKKREITLALMEDYHKLLDKFMADKANFPTLVEILLYMDFELYSLKGKEQCLEDALEVIMRAFCNHDENEHTFFNYGEKNTLTSCAKVIRFCMTDIKGAVQNVAARKLEQLGNMLIDSATNQVGGNDDEYFILVNLKRLSEVPLGNKVYIAIHEKLLDIGDNHGQDFILKVVKTGVKFAFTDAPYSLPFLMSGLCFFISKLQPANAKELFADLVSRRDYGSATDVELWQPFNDFLAAVSHAYLWV